MGAAILQLGCVIQCPHGGMATVSPTNQRVMLGGAPALLASDVYVVAGCPFPPSGTPHPCTTIEWQAVAQRVMVGGSAVVLSSSIGLCKAADGAVQGTAIVSGVQTRAEAI